MANIGTLAIKLTANPTGLHSALDQAEKKVGQFAGNVSKLLLSPLTGLAKAASVPANAVKSFLAPIQSLLTSIPFIGGALAAIPLTGVGFTEFLKAGADEILAVGREARKFGIDVSSMSALLLAAGDAGEAFVHGLGHMERTISEAGRGSKEAIAIFQALGLSAQELGSMAPDQAFRAVTDDIKGMGSAYDRAAALQAVFGKAGIELMPMLQKDLDAVAESGKKTGQVFGEEGLQNVIRASKAVGEISKTVDGLKRTLAIASAPFIEALAKGFQSLIDKSGGLKELVIKALDVVVSGLAKFLDVLTMVLRQLEAVGDAIKDIRSAPGRFADAINPINWAIGLGSTLGGIDTSSSSGPRSKIPDMGNFIRDLWTKGRSGLTDLSPAPAAAKESVFDPELFKRLDAIFSKTGDSLKNFRDQLSTLGEAIDKNYISAKQYSEGLNAIDRDLEKTLGLNSPLQTFFDQIQQSNELRNLGAAGIADKLLGKSFKDLQSTVASTDTTGSFGVEAGTVEDAQRTIRDLNQRHHDEMMSVENQILFTLQRALQVQTETDQMTAKVAAALEALGVVN